MNMSYFNLSGFVINLTFLLLGFCVTGKLLILLIQTLFGLLKFLEKNDILFERGPVIFPGGDKSVENTKMNLFFGGSLSGGGMASQRKIFNVFIYLFIYLFMNFYPG